MESQLNVQWNYSYYILTILLKMDIRYFYVVQQLDSEWIS